MAYYFPKERIVRKEHPIVTEIKKQRAVAYDLMRNEFESNGTNDTEYYPEEERQISPYGAIKRPTPNSEQPNTPESSTNHTEQLDQLPREAINENLPTFPKSAVYANNTGQKPYQHIQRDTVLPEFNPPGYSINLSGQKPYQHIQRETLNQGFSELNPSGYSINRSGQLYQIRQEAINESLLTFPESAMFANNTGQKPYQHIHRETANQDFSELNPSGYSINRSEQLYQLPREAVNKSVPTFTDSAMFANNTGQELYQLARDTANQSVSGFKLPDKFMNCAEQLRREAIHESVPTTAESAMFANHIGQNLYQLDTNTVNQSVSGINLPGNFINRAEKEDFQLIHTRFIKKNVSTFEQSSFTTNNIGYELSTTTFSNIEEQSVLYRPMQEDLNVMRYEAPNADDLSTNVPEFENSSLFVIPRNMDNYYTYTKK